MYSFTIVLYEILSLKSPYDKICSAELHQMLVCEAGYRPKVTPEWPIEVQELLAFGWENDPRERLSINEVCNRLNRLIVLTGQEETKSAVQFPRFEMFDSCIKPSVCSTEHTSSTLSSSAWGSFDSIDC